MRKSIAHGTALFVSVTLCWFLVFRMAGVFSDDVYVAMVEQDFSGLGTARADFTLFVIVLPIIGLLAYAAVRVAFWVIRISLEQIAWLQERKASR